MPNFVLWLVLVVLVSSLVLFAIVWAERHTWRRYEQWKCPNCGESYGHQEPRAWWVVWIHAAREAGGVNRGPILTCGTCNREFRYTRNGEVITEQSEAKER